MRIICDHCSRPISGTVERVSGNLNLHPDCLAQLGNQPKHVTTAVSWWNREPSVSAFGDWKGTVARVAREMK